MQSEEYDCTVILDLFLTLFPFQCLQFHTNRQLFLVSIYICRLGIGNGFQMHAELLQIKIRLLWRLILIFFAISADANTLICGDGYIHNPSSHKCYKFVSEAVRWVFFFHAIELISAIMTGSICRHFPIK